MAVWLLHTRVPALDLPTVAESAVLAPDTLGRAERFRSVAAWLWVAGTLTQLVALALLAAGRRGLARLAAHAGRGRLRAGALVAVAAAAAAWGAGLPAAAVQHHRAAGYGLAVQGWGAWLADRAIALGVLAALGCLAVALALWLARRVGPAWWLPFGAALAALGVAVVLGQPVLDAALGDARPLADPGLQRSVATLADGLGVEVGVVEVERASTRTTVPNARVRGIGPTRRVRVDDTLLDGRVDPAAVRVVVAHELAHVARGHVWKGAAWFALFVLPGGYAVARILRRYGDLGARDGVALVPVGLLLAFTLYLATLPAQSAISRRYEAEADWLALTVTRDAPAAVRLERTLAREALIDPDPPGWFRVLLATHPSPIDRIAMARAAPVEP